MLDYDCRMRKYVCAKVRKLQRLFSLPAFYVFRSSLKSYHAVCFRLVTKARLKKIFSVSGTDKLHRIYPDRVGYGTLRISRKKSLKSSVIKFVQVVPSRWQERVDLKRRYFEILGFEHGAKN